MVMCCEKALDINQSKNVLFNSFDGKSSLFAKVLSGITQFCTLVKFASLDRSIACHC